MPPRERDRERLKEWLELADYQRGEGPYPVECWDDGPPFGERYGRGDISCHLHAYRDVRSLQSHSADFCVEFHKVPSVIESNIICLHPSEIGGVGRPELRRHLLKTSLSDSAALGDEWAEMIGDRKDGIEHPVLVCIGEILQEGELVHVVARPPVRSPIYSVVRLVPLHLCRMVGMNFTEIPLTRGGPKVRSIGSKPGSDDGELDRRFSLDLGIGEPASQLPSEMVEDGPQILRDVANHQADVSKDRAEVGDRLDPVDVVTALFIQLRPKGWSIASTTNVSLIWASNASLWAFALPNLAQLKLTRTFL